MNIYTEHFAKEETYKTYLKKFKNEVDIIRHNIEVKFISPFVSGDLFDCSIGVGRFIKDFAGVARSYSGMDYSPYFVDHIKNNFPQVNVFQGDLLKGIPCENQKFDTVICLRTLFALPHSEKIILEMFRITKVGGIIILDYGTQNKDAKVEDLNINTSSLNLREFLRELPLKVEKIIKLDSHHCHQLKQKGTLQRRIFQSRYNIFPRRAWQNLEQLLARLGSAERELFILRKERY